MEKGITRFFNKKHNYKKRRALLSGNISSISYNISYKKHLYAQTAGFLEGWRGREGSSIKSKMPFLSLHTPFKKAPTAKKSIPHPSKFVSLDYMTFVICLKPSIKMDSTEPCRIYTSVNFLDEPLKCLQQGVICNHRDVTSHKERQLVLISTDIYVRLWGEIQTHLQK